MRSRMLVASLSAGMIATFAACGAGASGGDGSEVVIGATLPMTGDGAAYGKAMSVGLQAAVDDLNEADAVPGTNFKLVVTDMQAQPGLAVSTMNQLINAESADVIVSAYTTPPLAQLKSAERYSVPVLNGGGVDPGLLGHEWLFNTIPTATQEEKFALDYFKSELGAKRISVLVSTNFTQDGVAALKENAEAAFPGNVNVQTVDPTTTDPTPYVNNATSSDPDVIMLFLDGALLDQTLKQIGTQGINVPLYGYSPSFGIEKVEDLRVVDQLLRSRQAFAPSAEFLAAVKKVDPEAVPNIYTGNYYTIAKQIAEAVRSAKDAGDVNGESIRENLDALKSIDGCCGDVSFTDEHGVQSDLELVKTDSSGKQSSVFTAPAPAS